MLKCLTLQRDEDFDVSYEGLLSLSSLLGDAKPRGTPDDIIESLPRGTYREWTRPGATEERCPICLDDVRDSRPLAFLYNLTRMCVVSTRRSLPARLRVLPLVSRGLSPGALSPLAPLPADARTQVSLCVAVAMAQDCAHSTLR